MRFGLEVRCPYLDKDLLEFVASMPVAYKMSRGFNKTILRKSFASLLPSSVLKRKKSGFNVPLAIKNKSNRNEYKSFNLSVFKHKIDGKHNYSGI